MDITLPATACKESVQCWNSSLLAAVGNVSVKKSILMVHKTLFIRKTSFSAKMLKCFFGKTNFSYTFLRISHLFPSFSH